MPPGEFQLIERHFRRAADEQCRRRGDVPLGIGDDAALLSVPPGMHLVASLDTVVQGRHFLPGAPPESIGHRALAVNLSDIAAMGAAPAWYLLSLTMPAADEAFLVPFACGMHELASRHGVALVGGNTTRGPLVIAIQILGLQAPGQALRRSGARAGDLVYVSGTCGDAAAGLRLVMQQQDALRQHRNCTDTSGNAPQDGVRDVLLHRFMYPQPRVELGLALGGFASACIDVSDGLAADAARLAAASGCAVTIEADHLPLSPELCAFAGEDAARHFALTGGEDYELCFTVSPARAGELESRLQDVKCGVTCIGRIGAGNGIVITAGGRALDIGTRGFDHFA